MTIGITQFSAHGHFATFNPYPREETVVEIFQLQCRRCGYEVEEGVTAPATCPKCHASSWERFVRPGSILENALRY